MYINVAYDMIVNIMLLEGRKYIFFISCPGIDSGTISFQADIHVPFPKI